MTQDINDTLTQRSKNYGEFAEHARITQNIKRAFISSPNWARLSDDKKEALDMLAHKLGRILNGDSEFHDSWHDAIGYLTLVEKTLKSIEPKESLVATCGRVGEINKNGKYVMKFKKVKKKSTKRKPKRRK